jgi:hypothetical protein
MRRNEHQIILFGGIDREINLNARTRHRHEIDTIGSTCGDRVELDQGIRAVRLRSEDVSGFALVAGRRNATRGCRNSDRSRVLAIARRIGRVAGPLEVPRSGSVVRDVITSIDSAFIREARAGIDRVARLGRAGWRRRRRLGRGGSAPDQSDHSERHQGTKTIAHDTSTTQQPPRQFRLASFRGLETQPGVMRGRPFASPYVGFDRRARAMACSGCMHSDMPQQGHVAAETCHVLPARSRALRVRFATFKASEK